MIARISVSAFTTILLIIFSLSLAFSPSVDTLDVHRVRFIFELDPSSSFSIINSSLEKIRYISVILEIGSMFIVRFNIIVDYPNPETQIEFTNSSVSFDFRGIGYFILESDEQYIKGVIEIHYGLITWVN